MAVVAVAESDLKLTDLDEFRTERLARYKHPKDLEIVDALPRNPAGKVLKTELRARFGGPVVSGPGQSDSAATVSAWYLWLMGVVEFANGSEVNHADAVYGRVDIGYSPVVRLTTNR